MKQLDALWPQRVRHKAQARDVSTWASERGDKSRSDGISHTHDDDGDGLGGFFSCLRSRRIDGDDHLDFEAQKLFRECGESLIVPGGISQLEALLVEFHQSEWSRRADIVVSLQDDRFRELGGRLVASECPDVLSDTQRRRWLTWRRDRLLSEGAVPWLTIAAAREEIAALRNDANSEQLRQLAEIEQFFVGKTEMLNS